MKKIELPTKSFLVEIGTEELPSDAMRVCRNELKNRVYSWLDKNNLVGDYSFEILSGIQVEVTPRRIVICVKNIFTKQPNREEVIQGPSVKAAFTESNEPTKALLGFLKSKGATVGDVFKKTTERGEFVAVKLLRKGVKTDSLLKVFLDEIFSNFPFPKTMRWNVETTFPRPVRWVLALWDKDVLPIRFAGLKSDRLTYGHRFLADKSVKIKKADLSELEMALSKLHVTLSFEERAAAIRKYLLKTNPKDLIDEELIEMSASLTEDPTFIKGGFDKRFLKLPVEILATSMRKHQKIFVLYGPSGKVLPNFLAVVNGKKANPRLIQKNYENVLEAKLKDAEFFYEEDTKERLDFRLEKLKKVTFLGKLGTLYDKTERLRELSKLLALQMNLPEGEVFELQRAAALCKADLETQMVYEFPELQGFVGAEYARKQGESSAVSNAIKDHYLPVSAASDDPLNLKKIKNEKVTERMTGALLGIVDKVDTLVGALGIGIEAKGSEDPYALRRAANGIVLTVFEFKKRKSADLSFSLKSLVEKCIELYGERLKLPREEILQRFTRIIEERVCWVLNTERARDREILSAIFISSSDNLVEILNKFLVLKSIESDAHDVFYRAYKILERAGNILKGAKGVNLEDPINTELLQTEEERALFDGIGALEADFCNLMQKKSYFEGTRLYADKLYDRISSFFDRVLVNDKDESLRRNRLALMHKIYNLYTQKVADLSLLTQMEPPEGKTFKSN